MNKKKKHFKMQYVVFGILGLIAAAILIFMRLGGFTTGDNANLDEFARYAQATESIKIPESAEIIALGEATHGNIEFQQLKLDVFKIMVEEYNVKAFVLESDYGGCEQVNRYIHGGDGTAKEAAEALGFAIYRTQEMAELISYMRRYNEGAAIGKDLRFYGCDMQRIAYSFEFLIEACNRLKVDTTLLQKLVNGEGWSGEYDYLSGAEIIKKARNELENKENAARAIHCADVLLQYCELQALTASKGESEASALRDAFMAENVKWVLQQEQRLGFERIFVSGHNSHVAKWGSFNSMGKLLSEELENGYYVIGTDFYRTVCNMPARSSAKRTKQVFYSHDPLAKAAKITGKDICWLDFASVPENTELGKLIAQYTYMGNLGEGYSWLMRILPQSYRMFQPPAVLYDSMIFVAYAKPTEIDAQ